MRFCINPPFFCNILSFCQSSCHVFYKLDTNRSHAHFHPSRASCESSCVESANNFNPSNGCVCISSPFPHKFYSFECVFFLFFIFGTIFAFERYSTILIFGFFHISPYFMDMLRFFFFGGTLSVFAILQFSQYNAIETLRSLENTFHISILPDGSHYAFQTTCVDPFSSSGYCVPNSRAIHLHSSPRRCLVSSAASSSEAAARDVSKQYGVFIANCRHSTSEQSVFLSPSGGITYF